MENWTQEKFDSLKVGDKIRLFYNENNINNKLMHVRGFVDGLVVVRTYIKRKQRWYYSIVSYYELNEFYTIE